MKGSPQNSFVPTMRATGSPASRRAASRAISTAVARGQRLRRRGHQRGVVHPERVADQDARVELGRVETGVAQLRRERAARMPTIDAASRVLRRQQLGLMLAAPARR